MKKLLIVFLAGLLMLGVTACGNQTTLKDVAAQFKNSVFIGDSITEGFAINEILPKENIIADAGSTAGFVYNDIGVLTEKKPDHVFIMEGSNDILWPKGDPKILFESNMTKLVNKIKEEVPGSKIYLQSITPVTQAELKDQPRYKNIDDYNALLKELAGKLSVHYVDIGSVAKENPDLYAEDGVHFKKEFYTLWLQKLSESL